MAIDVGTAIGYLDLNTTKFKTGLNSAKTEFETFTDSTNTASSRFKAFGGVLTSVGGTLTKTVTLPLSAAATGAVAFSNKFETAMAMVNTIADTSTTSMSDLSDGILLLSNKTGESATILSNAMYDAISSGIKTADALNFTAEASKLATAGFTDTGKAVDVLTTIINAYGMSAEDTTHISDVLITTQNLGKVTVDELASYMGKAIPTANAYGVSLENLASAYSVTTSKGIDAAESTTYINSMIKELGDSSTGVAKTLKSETGQSFSGLMKSGKSLGDVLAILSDYASKNNIEFMNLWQSAEAGKAAASIAGTGVEGFNEILQETTDSADTTEKAYQTMSDTTQYKLNQATETAKNTFIKLGDVIKLSLVPVIESAVGWLQSFYNWFSSLTTQQQQLIVMIGSIAAAVGPILVVLGTVIQMVTTATTAISGFIAPLTALISSGELIATILGVLLSPVTLIIAGIAALATGLIYVAATNETVRAGLQNLLIALQVQLQPAIDFFTSTVIPNLQQAWQNLQNMIQPLATFLMGMFTSIWTDILLPAMQFFTTDVLPNLITVFETLWNGVLVPLGGFIGDVLGPVFSGLATILTWLWNNVVLPLADALGGALGAAFNALAALLVNVIIPTVSTLIDTLDWLWNNVLVPLGTFIGDYLGPIFTGVFSGIMAVVSDVIGVFTSLMNFLTDVFSGNWSNVMNDLGSAFTGVFDSIKDSIGVVGNLFDGMISGIKNGIDDIKGVADWVAGKLGIGGSHADGLSYVPYDGYVAQLHEGEKVLTRNEAAQYENGGGGGGSSYQVNIYSPQQLDAYEANRQFRKTLKEFNEGFI